jgi:GNAT superfamily N-acetyltransferase
MTTAEPIEIVPQSLREFSEQPGLYLTWNAEGKIARHISENACVVVAPTFAVAMPRRVAEGEVSKLLEDVRHLVPPGVRTDWYIGPSAGPAEITRELKKLGLRVPRQTGGTLHVLLLTDEPECGPAEIETHELATRSDHVAAAELRWEAFQLTDEEREQERGFLADYYDEYLRSKDRSTISFVATLDGRVAGSASALLSDRGLFLIGGATAPWARGRGIYRSLVRARWRYAVDRGTPALAVHAIANTSSPILRRLGFREICLIDHLEET